MPINESKRGPNKDSKLRLTNRDKRILVAALGYYVPAISSGDAVNMSEATTAEVEDLARKIIHSIQ